MKGQPSASSRGPVKPTAQNLVPIRLDLDIDGQRFKDCFTWNPSDPDSEIVVFARRTAKDLKLPPGFITVIASAIQLDLRVNRTVIRDQFLCDSNNFETDHEEFAKTFCADLGIQDPEVGPAIAFSIREQLYEIVVQSVASVRETRISKKGCRGVEYAPVRKRKERDVYETIVGLLSTVEVEALEAKEEGIAQ